MIETVGLLLRPAAQPNNGINRTRLHLTSYHRGPQRAGYAERWAASSWSDQAVK